MAGDIGDQNANVLVVNLDEIVEIAGDRSHGEIIRDDIQTAQLGDGVRKDGELNLASHLQYVVEGEELRSKLGAGFAKKDVAVYASLDHGGRERLVNVVDGTDFKAARFVFGAGLAGEKDDGDIAGGGIRFQAGADFIAVPCRAS